MPLALSHAGCAVIRTVIRTPSFLNVVTRALQYSQKASTLEGEVQQYNNTTIQRRNKFDNHSPLRGVPAWYRSSPPETAAATCRGPRTSKRCQCRGPPESGVPPARLSQPRAERCICMHKESGTAGKRRFRSEGGIESYVDSSQTHKNVRPHGEPTDVSAQNSQTHLGPVRR